MHQCSNLSGGNIQHCIEMEFVKKHHQCKLTQVHKINSLTSYSHAPGYQKTETKTKWINGENEAHSMSF